MTEVVKKPTEFYLLFTDTNGEQCWDGPYGTADISSSRLGELIGDSYVDEDCPIKIIAAITTKTRKIIWE